LELVVVPVSNVDRAKAFYTDQLGFRVDHDTVISAEERLVQLTPPGSACSIAIGIVRPSTGTVEMPAGSLQHLQLVVSDLPAARAELVEGGVDVSEIQVYDEGSLRVYRHAVSTTSGSSSSAIRMATAGLCNRSPAAVSSHRSPRSRV